MPAAVTPDASGVLDVAMTRKSGNLWVPAKINDVMTIDFVIDSGASDITLPRDVYLTLIRSGTLTKANYIGGANFGIADGSEVKGLKFKLASLQVGNQVLKDVVASVMPSDSATPLLGLSFLSRFQSWSVDNQSGTLKLLPIGAQPAPAPRQTAAASVQSLPVPPDPGQPAVPSTVATPVTVVQPPAATPPKVAEVMPRSGHVATAAFVAKETAAPAAPTAAATAPMAHPAVPVFPVNMPYTDARSSLLALGYGPAPLPESGKCDSTTDATCFPERTACAKSDAIHCNYLWRRGEVIKVKTVAVPPTVAAVECQVNCKQ